MVLILLISACGGAKKASRPAYRRPDVSVTPEKRPVTPEKEQESFPTTDTIEWVEVPANEAKPITTPEIHTLRERSKLKQHYNIAFLAPFRADNLVNGAMVDGNYKRFIDFYAGVKMAARVLEQEGLNINVKVFDTEYNDGVGKRIFSDPYLRSCDVIIGPYKRSLLSEAIAFGKENHITVVSPWISSNSLATDVPYYVQAKPSLTRHYEAIRDHIQSQELSGQSVLVVKEGETGRWNELAPIFQGTERSGKFFADTLVIRKDSLLPEATIFVKFLEKQESPVFFIPNASSQDESFVYNVLRKLNIDKGESNVMVYGPGTWLDYRDEVKDLLAPLNVRLSVSNLFDPTLPSSKELIRQYYTLNGNKMSADAAEGFDLFYFIGKALRSNGTYFQAFGEQEQWTLNQTGFDIRPVLSPVPPGGSPTIDFYENFYIQMIEYKDFQYRKVP